MLLALEGKEAVTRTADNTEFWVFIKTELATKFNKFLAETNNDAKLKLLADIQIMLEQFTAQAEKYLKEKDSSFDDYLKERRIYVGDYDKRLILTDIKKAPPMTDERKKAELKAYGEKHEWPAIILAGNKENPLKVLGPGKDKWDNALSWFDVSKDNVEEWMSAVRRDARL